MLTRSIALALAASLVTASPAFALDVRPSGYLERGQLDRTEAGLRFIPDSESGGQNGRYFRVGGHDLLVTYGLGNHPVADWVWPSYHLKAHVRDLVVVSPGGLSRLVRYEEAQGYAEGFARVGALILGGAIATAIGGLGYNFMPGNAREMTPGFWYATGGALTAGLLTVGLSNWAAHDNLTMLDEAIAAYNRDMAGKRRLVIPRPAGGAPTAP